MYEFYNDTENDFIFKDGPGVGSIRFTVSHIRIKLRQLSLKRKVKIYNDDSFSNIISNLYFIKD